MRGRIGCNWFSMKWRSLVDTVWHFELHKGIPWPAERLTASQGLCPFEVREWFLHYCTRVPLYTAPLGLSTAFEGTDWAITAEHLCWQWKCDSPVPPTELSTDTRWWQSTLWQLFYVPGRKLTKTWTRNYKHRYFITLYKRDRCKVYEVWSRWVVFWDGRRCLSAELAKSQVTVVWTSNNDLTWIWGHKFYGFSTNVHTNSREHYCAVLQLALVKQIKVNRPN